MLPPTKTTWIFSAAVIMAVAGTFLYVGPAQDSPPEKKEITAKKANAHAKVKTLEVKSIRPLPSAPPPTPSKESLLAWAKTTPETAVFAAQAWPDSPLRTQVLKSAGAAWANRDLTAALAWANGLPEGPLKKEILVAIAYEGARARALETLRAIASAPLGPDRDALIAHLANQWAAATPEAAAEWAIDFAPGQLGDEVVRGIATQWAETNPAAAIDFATHNLPDGSAKDRATVGILQRWVQTDSNDAMNWISKCPSPELQAAALEATISIWASQNPAALETWLVSTAPRNVVESCWKIYERTTAYAQRM